MWADNDTDIDFLNFSGVAQTVSEIILQANGAPVSIGLSGAWGTGKSSMVRLIQKDLASRERQAADPSPYIFVMFNPWLYQGYDDARAALLEVVARALHEESQARQSGVDRAQELLARVNWLRAARLAATAGFALAGAFSPVGWIAGGAAVANSLAGGDQKVLDRVKSRASSVVSAAQGVLNDPESPQEGIEAIRESFQATLKELDATLVILVDDLDRCMLPTVIATLEAMRLLLFMQGTAFVIAADEAMIKLAVRDHFPSADEGLVLSYFDKLVQVPIKIPPLGTHEVRAYLILLTLQDSNIAADDAEAIRVAVCRQLSESWRGRRVDRAFIQGLGIDLPDGILERLNRVESIAPVLASTSRIAGNPRLVKRFLNALSVRMSMAKAHGVTVEESVLLKLLLFERCADLATFNSLIQKVNEDADGKPRFLEPWERSANAGEVVTLEPPWDDSFVREWLAMSPPLGEEDLRGALYVAREYALLQPAEDRLSSAGAEILVALLAAPEVATSFEIQIRTLTPEERGVIMTKLLAAAAKEVDWGTPAILTACMAVAHVDVRQAQLLADFLKSVPPANVKAAIVPRIEDEPWGADVFKSWIDNGLTGPAEAAIKKGVVRGHVKK